MIAEGDLVLLDGGEAIAFARPTPAIEEAFDTKLAAEPEAPRRICRGQGQAAGDQGRRPHLGDGQCRPARRRRRARRDRRRRHRPVPHRIPVPGLGDPAAARERSSGSTARCSTRRATSRSSSAPSTSAATRACPISTPTPENEENPAMGWRALRLALDRDDADEGAGPRPARGGRRPRAAGHVPDGLRALGVRRGQGDRRGAARLARRAQEDAADADPLRRMLEVPSLAEMLDVLLPKLDFLSVGTNDLTQFLFAADRSNPRLAERYDWLSPAILRFLQADRPRRRQARGAARRLRRDGRAHAGGDGADRHRRPPPLDHAGRGRPGQGDDPLARRQGRRAPSSTGCSSAARRFPRRARRLGGEARRVDRLGPVAAARARSARASVDSRRLVTNETGAR